jgi:DNA-binding HxlR family transcriptional regulator
LRITEGTKEYARAKRFLSELAGVWPLELRTNKNVELSLIAAKARWLLNHATIAGIDVPDTLVAETIGTTSAAMGHALKDFDKKLAQWLRVDLLLHGSNALPSMPDLRKQFADVQWKTARKAGLLGKEAKVKIRRWINRRPAYLRVTDGILKSRGWRTEAWGRVYEHVASRRFSLSQACRAEDLSYQHGNTEKEFRNEAYMGLQRWRGRLYPVDHDWAVPERTFRQALENLNWKEPFDEERNVVRDAFFLCDHTRSSVEISERLGAAYPELSKSFPSHRFSRHVVYHWLSDPKWVRLGVVMKLQAETARRINERREWTKPIVEKMRSLQEQNVTRILQALKEKPRRFGAILQNTGIPRSTVDKNLRWLKETRLVNNKPGWHGEYFLTTEGREHLRAAKAELSKGSQAPLEIPA